MITRFIARCTPLALIDWCENLLLSNYNATLTAMRHAHPRAIEIISERRAKRMFRHAKKRVPAYGKKAKKARSLRDAPVLTKENYVKKYSYEERCVNGVLPDRGNIDESSGSSGQPTQWVRSYEEELLLQKMVQFEYEYLLKPRQQKKKFIVISAWSSGPWATGVKFCELMEHFSVVKSASTDVKDIVETIRSFGNKYNYLIAGYPAFLRLLLDEPFSWKKYDIHLLTGGEGISLELLNHLKQKLKKSATVTSSYGCSDIDIGIATETPLAKEIRLLVSHNKKLRQKLFGNCLELPMVFQYSPLMHYIENRENDFLITTLDLNTTCPKIRYAIRDRGQSIPFETMMDALQGYDLGTDVLKLPFLWVAGRVDGTLSFDGANVTPKGIEGVVYADAFLAKHVNSFMMKKDHDPVFNMFIELKKGVKSSAALRKAIHKKLVSGLVKMNGDFAESLANNPMLDPVVTLYKIGTGPFAEKRIKLKYIA